MKVSEQNYTTGKFFFALTMKTFILIKLNGGLRDVFFTLSR